MDVDDEWTGVDEISASLIAHQALVHALFTTLQERGLLSPEDVDQIHFDAAGALERAEPHAPRAIRRARAIFDQTSRNLARAPAKPA